MPETLQTARLSLRCLGPDDVAVVHTLFASEGHTIGNGPVRDQAETEEWLARRQVRYHAQGLAWYGLWLGDIDFVGSCGVFTSDRCGEQPEIGYEVAAACRGHRLAREAANAVALATHAAGHKHLWATIRPTSVASSSIAKSLGFRMVRSQPDAKGLLDYYRRSEVTDSAFSD